MSLDRLCLVTSSLSVTQTEEPWLSKSTKAAARCGQCAGDGLGMSWLLAIMSCELACLKICKSNTASSYFMSSSGTRCGNYDVTRYCVSSHLLTLLPVSTI